MTRCPCSAAEGSSCIGTAAIGGDQEQRDKARAEERNGAACGKGGGVGGMW